MTEPAKPYTLAAGDRVTQVMVYSLMTLVRGEVVTKEFLRVSTWLRTQGAPDFIPLYNVQILTVGGGGPVQQITFPEMHFPSSQILAFHIAPPAKDPPDYDASEPNRKMEPTTLLVGSFRFNGLVRMATQMNLSKYLEITRETYISMYEIDISSPSLPSAGVLHVPLALVRLNAAFLATRTV
jgi:hypothetical protein